MNRGMLPEEARGFLCPLSRTFSEPPGNCVAAGCILWRWVDLDINDDRFKEAIKTAIRDQKMNHKQAVKWMMENREELGLPTDPERGYCGLGGPA